MNDNQKNMWEKLKKKHLTLEEKMEIIQKINYDRFIKQLAAAPK